MNPLIPKKIYKNIYQVDYKKLKKEGIKCLLFDLDNTCIGYHEKEPTRELKKLFNDLKKDGFKVIIFSNAKKKRLAPFKNLVEDYYYLSTKPLQRNFKKVIKKYNYEKEEVCIIGDQIFTDVLGGNRAGNITCLVEPLTKEDFIITKIFRKLEQRVLRKIEKK